MRIHVGNLTLTTTKAMLREAFDHYGTVDNCRIPADRATKISKGYAYIDMLRETEGEAAISGLHNSNLAGNVIEVAEMELKRKSRRVAQAK